MSPSSSSSQPATAIINEDESDLSEPEEALLGPPGFVVVQPGQVQQEDNPFGNFKELFFKEKFAAHLAVFVTYVISYSDCAALVSYEAVFI